MFDRYFDKDVIKRDWIFLKQWFFSSENKRWKLGYILIGLFVVGIMALPTFIVLAGEKSLGVGLYIVLTLPVLLGIAALFPFIGINLIDLLWLSEKQHILRFKTFSDQDLSRFIRSRALIPLGIFLIVKSCVFFLSLIFIQYLYQEINLPLLKASKAVFYCIVVVFYTVISVIVFNWITIRHGNFLFFIVPHYPKKRPSHVSKDIFGRIEELRFNTTDEKGLKLQIYGYSFVCFFYIFPLVGFSVWGDRFPDYLLLKIFYNPFWIILASLFLLIMAFIMWKQTIKMIKVFPENRTLIPENMRQIFVELHKEKNEIDYSGSS